MADDISSAARTAIAQARASLQPYVGEDGRIEALAGQLGQLADSVSKRERIADDLLTVDRAVMAVTKADGPLSAQARAQNAQATRKAEAAYLEAAGGNVDAWRESARQNGRAD